MKKIYSLLTIFSIVLVAKIAMAGTSAGTSGADFLRIGVCAKPSSMGETSAALTGASAIFYNPAGLATVENDEFSASQVNWIENISYSNLAAAKTFKFGTLAVGANYLTVPPIQMVDNTGTKLDDNYNVSDRAISLGYAKTFSNHLRAGVVLSQITSSIADYSATALSAGAGAQYDISKPLTLAIAVQNLGSNIKFDQEGDPLPSNYKAGAAYTLDFEPDSDNEENQTVSERKLLVAADANLSKEVGWYGNAGLEYGMLFKDTVRFNLRAGYRSDLNDKVNGISLGLGADMGDYTLDYAYSGLGDLGMAHRLTLTYRLGSSSKTKHASTKNNYLN